MDKLKEIDEINEFNLLKKNITEYIIKCIDETIRYRQTSLRGTNSKFKVGYTSKSFQNYYSSCRHIDVNIDRIKEAFSNVYNTIKYEPTEEKRKSILQSLIFC